MGGLTAYRSWLGWPATAAIPDSIAIRKRRNADFARPLEAGFRRNSAPGRLERRHLRTPRPCDTSQPKRPIIEQSNDSDLYLETIHDHSHNTSADQDVNGKIGDSHEATNETNITTPGDHDQPCLHPAKLNVAIEEALSLPNTYYMSDTIQALSTDSSAEPQDGDPNRYTIGKVLADGTPELKYIDEPKPNATVHHDASYNNTHKNDTEKEVKVITETHIGTSTQTAQDTSDHVTEHSTDFDGQQARRENKKRKPLSYDDRTYQPSRNVRDAIIGRKYPPRRRAPPQVTTTEEPLQSVTVPCLPSQLTPEVRAEIGAAVEHSTFGATASPGIKEGMANVPKILIRPPTQVDEPQTPRKSLTQSLTPPATPARLVKPVKQDNPRNLLQDLSTTLVDKDEERPDASPLRWPTVRFGQHGGLQVTSVTTQILDSRVTCIVTPAQGLSGDGSIVNKLSGHSLNSIRSNNATSMTQLPFAVPLVTDHGFGQENAFEGLREDSESSADDKTDSSADATVQEPSCPSYRVYASTEPADGDDNDDEEHDEKKEKEAAAKNGLFDPIQLNFDLVQATPTASGVKGRGSISKIDEAFEQDVEGPSTTSPTEVKSEVKVEEDEVPPPLDRVKSSHIFTHQDVLSGVLEEANVTRSKRKRHSSSSSYLPEEQLSKHTRLETYVISRCANTSVVQGTVDADSSSYQNELLFSERATDEYLVGPLSIRILRDSTNRAAGVDVEAMDQDENQKPFRSRSRLCRNGLSVHIKHLRQRRLDA